MTHEVQPLPHQPSECPQCKSATNFSEPFCGVCKFDLRYGELRKNSLKGACIYCESWEVLSEEHIFPDWLKNHFPRRHRNTLHQLTRPERHEFYKKTPVHSHFDERNGDPYFTVVRNVCGTCNNGWMSQLQKEAKDLVLTLAQGQRPELSNADRETLARWSCMVTVNLECLGRNLVTHPHQLKALMQGSVPPGWRVSIGLMKDDDCAGDSFYRPLRVPLQIGPEEHMHLNSTYFCIEQAAFHTLSTVGDLYFKYVLLGAGLSEIALPTAPIWPLTEPFDRTAGVGLTRENLLDIQRQFGEVNYNIDR